MVVSFVITNKGGLTILSGSNGFSRCGKSTSLVRVLIICGLMIESSLESTVDTLMTSAKVSWRLEPSFNLGERRAEVKFSINPPVESLAPLPTPMKVQTSALELEILTPEIT